MCNTSATPLGVIVSVGMQLLWAPPPGAPTSYPCVDCGLMTGNFCDGGISVAYDNCFASERVPADYLFNVGQRTPLCSYCETLHEFCRFCRQVHSCTPPSKIRHWSGVPQSRSRQFDATVAAEASAREAAIRDVLARDAQSRTPRS